MKFNKGEYSFLAIIASLYVVSVYRYQTTPQYVLFSTGAFAIVYVLWGIFHHLRSKSLHFRIVLEYFLVAILGVAIVSTLLI